jgi:transcriptional regulator with XRE-family HTH domain
MTNERLKNLRKNKGYTQIKIQVETGIDQSDYSKIETGLRYPTVEQAKRLALLLDTSTDYIFGLTDVETPYPRKK